MWIIIIWPLVCLSSIAIAQEQAPTQVRVDAVQLETLQDHRQVTGNLRAVSRAEVASEEQGKVIHVEVDEAMHVNQGDVLARLDDSRLQIQLNEQQANLLSTEALLDARQAELDNAEWNLNRLKPLWEKEMTTEQNLRNAERDFSVSQAQLLSTQRELDSIQQRIELLQERLDDMKIYAPFDGWVVNRQIEVGEWVNSGDSIITLVSSGHIEAWLEVPERFKEPVHRYSDKIQLSFFDGKHSVTSLNSRIIPEVDPRVRTFMLVADLNTQDGLYVPGMSVTAWVPTGTKMEHKTVHADAVLRDQAGFYVFKAQSMPEGGYMATPVNIEVLFDHNDRVAIESRQLAKGDWLVIEGNERLRPMTPLKFINEPAEQKDLQKEMPSG